MYTCLKLSLVEKQYTCLKLFLVDKHFLEPFHDGDGALKISPHVKRPRNISAQMERPLNEPSAVIFCLCDILTQIGWIVRPSKKLYSDLKNLDALSQCNFDPL
jgi:hypothetical protein